MHITFLPINKKINAEPGTNLMKVAAENGIDLNGTCAGNRTCGKCKALITKGNDKNFSKEELKFLTEEERNAGMRLTCCFTVNQDTSVILTGRAKDKNKGNTGDETKDKARDERQDINKDKTSDKAKISRSVHHNSVGGNYGVAFDIGTTTVEAALWDLNSKMKLGQQTEPNPQRLHGADVISRITYANSSKENSQRLTKLIHDCCNQLIASLAKEAGVGIEEITSLVIAANTTMSHLFLGKSLESLAKVPFRGISYNGEELKAKELGIQIHPQGTVYVMPGIGGHVGSDTVGCILAEDLASMDGIRLMMDIGTNGEMVLARDKNLVACSTAAGPAFEGASLHQGMRASYGAISKVEIIEGKIQVEVIDQDGRQVASDSREENQTPALGICGSGVIEAISELYVSGMMDETGRLLGQGGEDNYVTLWQGTGDKEDVILTQKDIREIQLAKGAIFAGVQLLLREENLKTSDLDGLYLAGTFGNYLNIGKGMNIGLLPRMDVNKVQYIGNGALTGAGRILLGEVSKEEAERISRSTRHLELALIHDFQDEFLKAISLPE